MKRLLSFKYALQGVKELFTSQPNARIHLLLALLVVIMGVWLRLNFTEWAIIASCIAGVLTAEAFNTAIEHLTDLVSPDYHVLAGKTKDVAAGAVLLAALGAATAGLCILGPKLWDQVMIFF